MGFFNKLKAVLGQGKKDEKEEFEKVIVDTYEEYALTHNYFWSPEINKTTVWSDTVKNWSDKKKIAFVLSLLPIVDRFMAGRRTWSSDDEGMHLNNVRQAYVHIIFRNKLLMDDDDAVNLYYAFHRYHRSDWGSLTQWPIGLMINQLQQQRNGQKLSAGMRTMLENMKAGISDVKMYYEQKERIKMIEKIDAMLFNDGNESNKIKPARFLGEDRLAEFANPFIETMPEQERLLWYQLLPLAQKATGSKPSKKYLDETKTIVKELGTEKFKKTMHEWLRFLINLKENEEQHSSSYNGRIYTHSTFEYITSVNVEAIKGLVWICSHFHDNATIQTIGALAERAFKKIPGKGPTNASMGNACLYALYKSKGLDGIGQLSRLRLRIKQGSTQGLIDKYLQAAAEEQGVSVSEIEDMAVDDHGIVNGSKVFQLDDYKAELTILAINKTEIKWFKPDGSLQKSIPVFVKEKHASRLKKIKDVARQVEQSLVTQRDRIDRMFRDDRKISRQNFEEYYLNHGLMGYLSRRIIWNFHKADKTVSAILLNNYWVNFNNEIVGVESYETVSLWHPVQATVADIKAWRDFLIFHELQQPLKQAFREVYLLTDAEVNTKSYSNRMAAHILKQHQFNSLAKSRGWRFALMGAFDNGINDDKASLVLPEHKLRAEYWVNEVNADGAMNDTGIWNYVSTDQVRFIDTDTEATVDLIDIPPLVFSEVMRDVDLFVGVASIGNDPTWQDSGGISTYRDYWTSYSFGDLSEVAKNRKEILSSLVPRLKIKDVATIKDKFLVVKGKLRTYKIHIGSTNILMEPNDQYLCIVPDRSQKNHTENLFLPFEGDSGLSIILSKAFLLADDDKITDATITSQINRR